MNPHRAATPSAVSAVLTGWRRLLPVGLALLLGACGFQLRGKVDLPFETMYLDGNRYSALTGQLRRGIEGGSRTRLTESPAEAQAVVALLGESQERGILAVSGGGRVRELQLRYRVSFKVHNGKGRDWLPVTEVTVLRDMTFDESQILAKEGEAQLLFRDMQTDAVQQVLRRIQAIRASSEVEN